MRRLYSTFPGGFPGIGLLLLRTTIGGSLIIEAYDWSTVAQNPAGREMWAPALLATITGISFIFGLLTPFAGFVSVFTGLAIHLYHPDWGSSLGGQASISISSIVIAVALTLIGPGAFSLDARLFGRRKVIVPRGTDW